MIAKLVVWGDDRGEAARRMQDALASTVILGVKTNLAFLERVVGHPAFLEGDTDTAFIARHRDDLLPTDAEVPVEALVAAASRVFLDEQSAIAAATSSPWNDTRGWRLNQPSLRHMELACGDARFELDAVMQAGWAEVTYRGKTHRVRLGPCDGDRLQVALDDETYFARVYRAGALLETVTPQGRYDLSLVDPFHYEAVDAAPDARLTSLMPGRVVKVMARAGDEVKKGQALLILEAMKMEHTIVSPRDGVIERAAFEENQLVPADAVLFAFRED
jgi:3-methylcrotonyl-CoA carboxylase alpha subunit